MLTVVEEIETHHKWIKVETFRNDLIIVGMRVDGIGKVQKVYMEGYNLILCISNKHNVLVKKGEALDILMDEPISMPPLSPTKKCGVEGHLVGYGKRD